MFDCELSSFLDSSIELKSYTMYLQDPSKIFCVSDAIKAQDKCEYLKTQGNNEYRNGNFSLSLTHYQNALNLLDFIPPGLKYHYENRELKKVIHLNIAAVKMKSKDWRDVVRETTIVLSQDEKNVKALYRRAMAHFKLRYVRECLRDLRVAIEIAPNDPQIRSLYDQAKALPNSNEKERNMFDGIFL